MLRKCTKRYLPNPNMNELVLFRMLKTYAEIQWEMCRGDINYFSKKQTYKHTEEQHLDMKSLENTNINA